MICILTLRGEWFVQWNLHSGHFILNSHSVLSGHLMICKPTLVLDSYLPFAGTIYSIPLIFLEWQLETGLTFCFILIFVRLAMRFIESLLFACLYNRAGNIHRVQPTTVYLDPVSDVCKYYLLFACILFDNRIIVAYRQCCSDLPMFACALFNNRFTVAYMHSCRDLPTFACI